MKDKKLIIQIQEVTISYMGIIISDQKAKLILEEYPTIRKWGADDTEERSNIINFVCQDICGMDAPIYGSSKQYKQNFKKSIIENAESKGYKLEGFDEEGEYD